MSHKRLSNRCQVCRHEERWRVELLRAGGATLDSLAKKFDLSRDAIHSHWNKHVSDELKASYLCGPAQLEELAQKAALEGDSVLDYLKMVRTVLTGQLDLMVQAGDSRGAAYVAGQLVSVLEKIARVTGEIGSLAQSVSITNNYAILSESPAFMKVEATLLKALARHPEARADVVASLRALDSENAPAAAAAPAMKVIEHVAG